MKVERKPLAEITKRAIEVLTRELGPTNTIRFINQFANGHGDYTSERDVLFKDLTMDQILVEIRQTPRSRSEEPTETED